MTKSYLFPMALAAVLIIPGITFAAQYHYVDDAGRIETIEAASAQQALSVAATDNPDTGVALDMGLLEEGMYVDAVTVGGIGDSGDSSAYTYQYVDAAGNVRYVNAMNADQALMLAADREPNSGVVLVEFQPDIPASLDVTVR